ncbi:hypothetical protein QAD02_022062 [Eretmocerus hayati]|uniref:Uncharacterized protein n=3 Tax=Eretmocerus hayati TaxID=131215 RepID=A0ACC2NBP5_9HYME|nr:hypothetical protein QAD02_010297 [Eretmocerus hayati]KAJ8672756.1 hypothetical protein QAD02_004016 [Eretmocerus hayati]KAJ8686268.1 hypothetical protein QAD02_022062 [Eretmocerus hayati]
MELTGRVFDSVHCSTKAKSLDQVRKIVHGTTPVMREYPNHKFGGCHPILSTAEAARHAERYLLSPTAEVSWVGLERVYALPHEDRPLSEALDDFVYLRVEHDRDLEGRDPKPLYKRSVSRKPRVSFELSEVEERLNRELARTADQHLLFPCAFNADPGLGAKTPLDSFPLNVNPAVNKALGDRPGITRPLYNIAAAGSFTTLGTEDGNCDSAALSLFGGAMACLVIRPEHEEDVHNMALDILSRCRPELVSEWKAGCNKPLHHRRIVFAPKQLRKRGIPFEITIVFPGDLIRFGVRSPYMIYYLDSVITVSTDIGGPLWNDVAGAFSTCACGHAGVSAVAGNMSRLKLRECEEPGCHVIFRRAETGRAHALGHTGVERLACGICQKTYASKRTLRGHQKTHSPYPRGKECPRCSERFTPSYLPVHLRICKSSYECDCGETFWRGTELANHRRRCPVVLASNCNPRAVQIRGCSDTPPTSLKLERSDAVISTGSAAIADSSRGMQGPLALLRSIEVSDCSSLFTGRPMSPSRLNDTQAFIPSIAEPSLPGPVVPSCSSSRSLSVGPVVKSIEEVHLDLGLFPRAPSPPPSVSNPRVTLRDLVEQVGRGDVIEGTPLVSEDFFVEVLGATTFEDSDVPELFDGVCQLCYGISKHESRCGSHYQCPFCSYSNFKTTSEYERHIRKPICPPPLEIGVTESEPPIPLPPEDSLESHGSVVPTPEESVPVWENASAVLRNDLDYVMYDHGIVLGPAPYSTVDADDHISELPRSEAEQAPNVPTGAPVAPVRVRIDRRHFDRVVRQAEHKSLNSRSPDLT